MTKKLNGIRHHTSSAQLIFREQITAGTRLMHCAPPLRFLARIIAGEIKTGTGRAVIRDSWTPWGTEKMKADGKKYGTNPDCDSVSIR